MAAFRIDDSKRLGSRRVTPMCAVHTSFLLTLLTMSNTMGFAKKRVISKTAVPTMFPSKLALSQRSQTLSQSLDAEARPSSRAAIAAGPGSERRTPPSHPGTRPPVLWTGRMQVWTGIPVQQLVVDQHKLNK